MAQQQGKSRWRLMIVIAMILSQPAFVHAKKKQKVSVNNPVPAVAESEPMKSPAPPVPEQLAYPESALIQAHQEEVAEMKRAEEAERKAIQARDEYESKKVEVENQIAAKKFQIESLRMKTEKVQADLEIYQTEINHLNEQQSKTEAEWKDIDVQARQHSNNAESTKRQLEVAQTKLNETLDGLRVARERTKQAMNKNQIEIQRMQAEMAVLEAEAEAAQTKRAQIEADEMKTRADWLSVRQKVEELENQKRQFEQHVADTQKRYEQALKDLKTAQNDLGQAEKEKNQYANRMQAEVVKLESQIASANRARSMAEAERIRNEAETEKLKAYVTMVRQSKDRAVQTQEDAEGVVLQSKLALETAKSELTKEVARGDKEEFRVKRSEARLRGLASAAEASEMVEGGRVWLSSKTCKLYRRPSVSSQEMGVVNPGRRLVGAEVGGAWVKLMNTSGSQIFVDRDCGRFE